MSSASHHAEWLQLVPHTGPFLSLPVLQRAFPNQLEPLETGLRTQTWDALGDWREQPTHPAVHRAWILHVLQGVLHHTDEILIEGQAVPPGLEARLLEHGEVLRPDFVILNPASHAEPRKPRLLVCVHPTDTDLDKPLPDRRWKASPAARMAELCHAANVSLGLVTNGDHWLLVWAPRGETTGYASWFAHLWSEEPLTFRAFTSLLRARRFFAVAPGDTLDALYTESARDQSEVTDQLGIQVRQAVQVLIQSLDRLDATHGRTLLIGISEKEIYNAALTVMMRLVFLFCAEEKGLLLLGNHLYDAHYAVSTLRELLRETADRHGEELLESRHDGWCRLLATFRAIHGGIQHDELRLPAYGGGLFDPDRYPFLEGRAADTQWQSTPARPLEINNRVVLHLLEALQTLETKLPGTSERQRLRLSFRALDIEQIGHVYEGLLDHTAKQTDQVILGLTGKKGLEPEVSLAKLEELAGGRVLPMTPEIESLEPDLLVADRPAEIIPFPAQTTGPASYSPPEALLEYLHETTGRAKNTLAKALIDRSRVDDSKLLVACGLDHELANRVAPYAALLLEDTFGRPLIFPSGCLRVTHGTDRRSSCTHYTPRSLTEPIVQYTLEPLVYVGPAEGAPKEQWKLKSARELLALKVCDMAMGSGAFLVQTCRYLAERLVEAWELAESAHPGAFITTPEGDLSTGAVTERLLPGDPAERLAIARRYVADRCLYGVDINPMAVEMAKLSLWLITLQRDRPFTFLDHALKCGDSLLGVTSVEQIENFSLRPGDRQITFATANLPRYVEQAGKKRRELEDLPSNDLEQIGTKNRLHDEAEAAIAKIKALADCLIALELCCLDGDTYEDARDTEATTLRRLFTEDAHASRESLISTQPSPLAEHAKERSRGRRPFHWPLEFPEVFARTGFDALVGNPPFQGGTVASAVLGTEYTGLVKRMNEPWHGKADLVGAFFRHGSRLVGNSGFIGFLATASLARGETADSSLRPLVEDGSCIFRARSPFPWPGSASVTAVCAWISRDAWTGQIFADDKLVEAIGIDLEEDTSSGLTPKRLPNTFRSFLGVKLAPNNQPLKTSEAETLPAELRAALLPAIGGDELGNLADPMSANCSFEASLLTDEQIAECGRILNKVLNRQNLTHSRPATELRELMHRLPLLLACNETTHRHLAFRVLPTRNLLLKHTAIGIPAGRWAVFSVLQSTFHETWAWKFGIRRKEDLRYLPKRCSDTFPLPQGISAQLNSEASSLDAIGEKYHHLRCEIMVALGDGLTGLYNRFHDQSNLSEDIVRLRALHVEMDRAVAGAYGWTNLDLGHGFHATKQGERYTLSEPARRTVLDRLLALNHQRYAEEVKAGLHDKGTKKGKAKVAQPPCAAPQGELIAPLQQDLFS